MEYAKLDFVEDGKESLVGDGLAVVEVLSLAIVPDFLAAFVVAAFEAAGVFAVVGFDVAFVVVLLDDVFSAGLVLATIPLMTSLVEAAGGLKACTSLGAEVVVVDVVTVDVVTARLWALIMMP